jgi:hypothetical protein
LVKKEESLLWRIQCVLKNSRDFYCESLKILHVTSRDFHIFINWGIVAKFLREIG